MAILTKKLDKELLIKLDNDGIRLMISHLQDLLEKEDGSHIHYDKASNLLPESTVSFVFEKDEEVASNEYC